MVCSGDSYTLNLFRSGVPVDQVLARSWAFLPEDVVTMAKSAEDAQIELESFADTIVFFSGKRPA